MRPNRALPSTLVALGLLLGCSSSGGQGDGGSAGGDAGGSGVSLGAPQTGIATYYSATGDGACMLGPSPQDLDVAALNAEEWQGSALCGACAEVVGPKGAVTVRIVDLCPECKKGHLDLSREAFAKIADPVSGRVDISWKLVSCNASGPIRYRLKDGASQWWTAIQVRNHKVPVRSLAYEKGGTWVEMKRESYNYFVEASGTGPAPIKLRVTSTTGATLEDTLPDLVAEKEYAGRAQFP